MKKVTAKHVEANAAGNAVKVSAKYAVQNQNVVLLKPAVAPKGLVVQLQGIAAVHQITAAILVATAIITATQPATNQRGENCGRIEELTEEVIAVAVAGNPLLLS